MPLSLTAPRRDFVRAADFPHECLRSPNRRAAVRLVFVTAATGTALLFSLVVAPPASPSGRVPPDKLERAAVGHINATRRAHGLRALVVRADLRVAARRHSRTMASRNRLYHSDLSRIPNKRTASENVGYGGSVSGIHRMLVRSRPHRHNLLDPRMRQVGVAVADVGGQLWVTQIFRQPR